MPPPPGPTCPGARRREKEVSAVWEKVKRFFVIPADVLPEFWGAAYQHNRLSVLVICVMIFGMELFNMGRVLFWSGAGLGTLNNRIYFGLYCALLLSAALCLLLDFLLRRRSLRTRLAVQYGGVVFFLIWHVCINAYDLFRNPQAEIGLYYTAVLGLSVFILLPALPAFLMHGGAYALLMLLAGTRLSAGDRVNITCTAIVALAVSLTNCRHYVIMIAQRMEISRINEHLRVLAQRDSLTGLLNKAAFQRCVEPHLGTPGVTLLIVDLDDFKTVNDRFGHPCGDFVLKETALQAVAVFPNALGLSRIGGDEFAVLLGKMEETRLESAARELIRQVSQITWHGQNVGAGCSIGGCCKGDPSVTYERLYSEADRALYQAKAEGKGRFRLTHLI